MELETLNSKLETIRMQIAQVVACTEAEGPGKRFAVWFQGCPLRCPGCCNPEFLPFKGGETKTLDEMAAWMERTREETGVEGITLLGGEPFAHAAAAAGLARTAHRLGMSVMVFSGFLLEDLRAKPEPEIAELIAHTDILVDGPYDRDQPDTERRWIGSTNQRIHFLTPRYSFDEQWRRKNTLEIRMVGSEISINGFPAGNAVGLWKGWKRKRNLTPQPPSPGVLAPLPLGEGLGRGLQEPNPPAPFPVREGGARPGVGEGSEASQQGSDAK